MAGTGQAEQPGTIREMLLWLYWLGQSDKKTERDRLESYIGTTLCTELTTKFSSQRNASSTIQKIADDAKEAKKLIAEVCNDAGHIIVCIQKGDKCDVKKDQQCNKHNSELEELKQEAKGKNFDYPTNNNGKDLFNRFVHYLTYCYWQMRLLYTVCNVNFAVGGWGQCQYGQQVSENYKECKTGGKENHNQRCSQCTTSIYKGCLMGFLTYEPMGWPKNKLPESSKTGGVNLHRALDPYFKDQNKNFPHLLSKLKIFELLSATSLTSSSTSLTVPQHWGLAELFGFWTAFWQEWYNNNTEKAQQYQNGWKEKFEGELKGQGQNGATHEWNKNPGSPDSLLDNLFKKYSDTNPAQHQNSSTHNSLLTLIGCEVNSSSASSTATTCGKYLHGLLELPFKHVCWRFQKDKLFEPFMNSDTIKEFAEKFKEKLEAFKRELEKQTCVKQTSSCQCIVWCDVTHAFLYKNGLTFMSPISLNGNKGSGPQRKCNDLKDQLEHVLQDGAPLDKLTKLEKKVLPRPPRTIREMLLWLHGLTKDKTSEKSTLETYIGTTLNGSLTKNFASQSSVSSVSTSITKDANEAKGLIQKVCKEAGEIIVCIEKGVKYEDNKHKTELEKLKQELKTQPLTYETEDKRLYNQFLYYFTCCYWQLKFLYTVCGANSGVGGWAGCRYGNSVTQCNNHKERCKECSNNSGCLQAFLTEGSEGDKKTPEKNIYKDATYSGECPQGARGSQKSGTSSCPLLPMGFPQNTLPSSSKQGSDLNTSILNSYFNGRDTNFAKLMGRLKLLQLLEGLPRQGRGSTSPLSVPTSWVAGDLWAFFYQLKGNTSLKHKLNEEIKKTYGNGFQKQSNTNAQSADYNDLNEVFTKLLFPGHSSSHPNSLFSLSECSGDVTKGKEKDNSTNKCGKYLYGLFSDPFHHVLSWFNDQNNTKNIELLSFDALKEFARKLKEKLTEFKNGLETNGNECVTNPSCKCIVYCDETHAFLYRNGFTFMSPKSLAVIKTDSNSKAEKDDKRNDAKERKCKDLKEQLGNVTKEGSGLTEFTQLVKYEPPPPPPKAPQGQLRSEPTQDSVQPPVTARPVAAPPEAPKPQGAKPAATKPATSKPEGKGTAVTVAPVQAASGGAGGHPSVSGPGTGSGGSGGGKSSSSTVSPSPPGPGSTDTTKSAASPPSGSSAGGGTGSGGDSQGDSSTPGVSPSATPGPPPPPPPAAPPQAGDQQADTAAVTAPTIGKGAGRSGGGSLQVSVPADDKVGVTVPGPTGPARAASPQPQSVATPTSTPSTTTPSTGTNGAQGSPKAGSRTGTVKITDNKDGVGDSKDTYSKVLEQLLSLFTAVSQEAYDLTSKVSTRVLHTVSVHLRDPLTTPPQSVKECIEWIICCEQYDGAQKLHQAIKALLGTDHNVTATVISDLITKLKSFLGFDNDPTQFTGKGIIKNDNNKSYNWRFSPQRFMFKNCNDFRTSNVQCCKKKDCQECEKNSGCETCYARTQCRIFLLIVPVLWSVLKFLSDKCNSNWKIHKLNENNGTTNAVNSSLRTFMLTCGYDAKHLNDKQGSDIKSILDRAIPKIATVNRQIFKALQCNNTLLPLFSTAASSSLRLPGTVSEMLLWMFFLPFCSKYSTVLERLTCLLCKDCQDPCACKSGTAVKCNCTTQKPCTHTSAKQTGVDHRMLKSVFDHIPLVLLSLGGHDGLKATLFRAIEKISKGEHVFEYYCHGDASQTQDRTVSTGTTPCCHSYCTARTVMAIIVIVDLVFQHLRRQCHKENHNTSAVWEFQRFTGKLITTERQQSNDCSLYNFVLFMGFTGTHLRSNVQQLVGSTLYRRCERFTQELNNTYKKVREWFRSQKDISSKCQCVHCASCVQDNALSQTSSTTPSTVRQMMLWFIGLPLTEAYKKDGNGLVSEVNKKSNEIDGLKQKITSSTGTASFELQYSLSIFGMLTVFSAIEGHLTSVLCYLRDRFRDHAPGTGASTGAPHCTVGQQVASSVHICSRFTYNDNGENLLRDFCTYVYKVHFQLRFLMVMCSTPKADGGWRDCEFHSEGGTQVRGITCSCSGGNFTGTSCPTPLRRFLLGNQRNKFNISNQSDIAMGFEERHISVNRRKGSDILTYLKELLDPINTESSPTTPSKPLSLLAQYCVAIGQLHPQSLGDFFAFFEKLGTEWDSLKLYGQNGEKFKTKLEAELNGHMIGQNGQQEACDELKGKITAILTTHSDHTNKKDLMSLMCNNSSGTNGCAPYMKSLSSGLYSFYAPQITGAGEREKFGVFQYLYDMLRKLLDRMKELKGAFEKCQCCKNSGSKTPCTNLVECPNAHPILYRFGFVFGDAEKLKNGSKKCQDIKARIGNVLSFQQKSESALFKAFECVIQVTYKVLLERAKACVTKKYNTSTNGDKPAEGLQSTNQEMNTAFMLYVSNAMYQSYPTLICTFACKVFDGNHDCKTNKCEERFKETTPGPKPTPLSNYDVKNVQTSQVTLITPIIPHYTAPVIDRYHYKTFNKEGTKTGSNGNSSNHYSFTDAIEFHVSGANCIRPGPVALRSVIDWMLRVTTGAIATQEGKQNGSDNENIKALSEAIKSVLGAGVNNGNVQSHLTSLVTGLRKFMGYNDKSESVKEGVNKALGDGKTGNGVKKLLEAEIKKIEGFIGEQGKAQFGSELGKALLKGRYREIRGGVMSNIISIITDVINTAAGVQNDRDFKKVVKTFTEILTLQHTYCNSQLKCTDFQANSANSQSTSSSTVTAEGLKELHEFFEALKTFAALWDTIGNKSGDSNNPNPSSDVVHTQKTRAATEVSQKCNGSQGSSPSNNDYFTKLYQALAALGQCATQVQALENKNNGATDSQKYRQKITDLITGLKEFGTHIKGCNFSDTKDPNGKSDPAYAVKGAEELIKKTISNVEEEITKKLKETAESAYTLYNGDDNKLKIGMLLFAVNKHITEKLDRYKSHLDDLKQLCQWLYRMGQLYASGLKGFVESLVSHLEHIIQVIDWIEKLKVFMSIVMNSDDAQSAEVQQSITAGASTIAKLLSSYVLRDADSSLNITDDKASKYRTFLLDLRLLALDRYTLQVWQDECNPNDSRPSAIKDWITFEGGIVRHSDFGAIKTALQSLTNITPVASTTAPPSASHRIHDFHAICVIQKFSFEAPMAELERSLEKLKGIQKQLEGVKKKCENGTQDLSTDSFVTSFCDSVSQFLLEPYGIYSFAKFVHTILGPNVFSAVIGALEELTSDKLSGLKGENGDSEKRKKFCGIVTTMCEGLEGENNKEHYKLDNICKKLEAFIATLRKEYIFCYPAGCGIESDKDCKVVCPGECSVQCSVQPKDTSLACSSQSSVTNRNASTPSLTSLSPMPLLCTHCHLTASICPECIPLLAKIFITLVPVLYPQLCYLAYQCHLYWCEQRIMDCNPLSSLLHTFGWPRERLSNYYIAIDVQIHGRFVSWLLSREENSLRLLCDNFTKEYNVFPFNTDSPLFKLYHLCLAYYQRRRSQSLTHTSCTPPVMPTSLCEILRFFVYLPFSTQFQSLQEVLRSYCSQSCVVHYADLFATLMMSSAMSAVLLQLIECPQEEFLCFFDDIYTNREGYHFGTNTENLFFQLCDLSVTLYRSLKFLSLQCYAEPSLAGWNDCRLRDVKRNSDRRDITQPSDSGHLQLCASHLCECQSTEANYSSTTCSATIPTASTTATTPTTTCSLPLLRYLTDGALFASTVTVPSALRKVCLNDSCQEMLYRHMAPRGWQKEKLQCEHREGQKRDRQLEVCNEKPCCSVCYCHPCRAQCCVAMCSTLYGHDLFHLLRNLVGHEHDADPLLQFTRYMVAIAAWPPDSFSGYMTFMLRFSDQLRKEENATNKNVSVGSVAHENTSQKNGVNSSVLSSLEREISLFPGEFNPKCLIEAFLRVTHCDHNNGAAHTPVGSSATATSSSPQCTTSSVMPSVLSDCKDCQRLLRPLDYEIYDLYLPMYARRYLTWMLHFGPRLQRGMRALEDAFKRHIEDKSVSQSGVSATDPGATQSAVSSHATVHSSIVQCPFALPELHAAGLHFWDPKRMCNEKNNISCQCLLDALQCPLKDSSPLAEFLHECEHFLWSVRKPFYWLSMALWIVATVYLLFVHLWRLDLARLLSHVIRSRASHVIYPKVILSTELDHSYTQYYAQR